ncbi:MAG TPA: hypothetical protein VHG28_23115 [Longimicrobiaceae bacterium]|nr:hypothetical protein [Longimicrobiaceae bacterium]
MLCTMDGTGTREEVLRAFGAGDAEAEELLRYNENVFRVEGLPDDTGFPLADEPFVEAWTGYAAEAERRGVVPTLREELVQLRFPVAEGISATEEYRNAVQRGIPPTGAGAGLLLEEPESLRLFLHPTAAGRIPVLVAENRNDFMALLRALARRNEPDPIPASMGACTIAGYNNWGRVARLRQEFERGELQGVEGSDWATAFRGIRERRELYQDRFILLSAGPYSGVGAAELGLREEVWLKMSRTIRLEHECTHYFTRRLFGSMRNTLLDELIADYVGIVAAAGRYHADWFLRFMGLEDPSAYRQGGRLQNYRGRPALSDGAFLVLQSLVRSAARRLEEVDRELPCRYRAPAGLARMVTALAAFTLDELAGPGAADLVRERLRALSQPPG